MNALVVLSALVSAAVAVPHNSRLLDNYGGYGGEVRIVSKSYDEPRYISAPVVHKSYAEPRLISAPVYTKAYAQPEISYGYGQSHGQSYGQVYGQGYGHAEPVYAKSYGTPSSIHYSIKHDVPQKHYSQPIYAKSYAAPRIAYAHQPVLTKSYAEPIVSRHYEAPILAKSYSAPIAEPIRLTKAISYDNYESDYGYGKGY